MTLEVAFMYRHDISHRYICQQGGARATFGSPRSPLMTIVRPVACFSASFAVWMHRGMTTVSTGDFEKMAICDSTFSAPACALPPRPAVTCAPIGRMKAADGRFTPSLAAAPCDARQRGTRTSL